MEEEIPTTSTQINMPSSSLSNMIAKTDEYESILAWNELEQKHYSTVHHRRCGDNTIRNPPSLSLLFKNGNAEKLSTWCRNVLDHFHLPSYLVEWTMNFVHRYTNSKSSVRDNDAFINTHTLKTMTAVALRLCIRLDAGQTIYGRPYSNKNSPTSVNLDEQQNQQHHIDAITTIPQLVSRPDEKPMTMACLHQMFFKLEIVLMKSLGFYLHPPLTEHYLEEIHKIVENITLSDMESNGSLKINKSYTVLLLQQIKTRAVLLAQSTRSPLQSNCSFENDDDEVVITPSACSVAIYSYLAALHLSAINYYNRDIAVAECCKELYKILLDAFLDVIVKEPSLPKEKKVETIEGMVEALVLSSETTSCCFGVKDHGQHKKDVAPRLSQEESNVDRTHHQCHASAVAVTASPIQLGKRKASPTSVIMFTKHDDDDCKNDGSSVSITSPMKKVSLNQSD